MTISARHHTRHVLQGRRLALCLLPALAAVVLLTPLFVSLLDARPRKVSVSVLRFTFLLVAFATWQRNGPGLGRETGLATAERPLAIWWRGFLLGAIPLTLYVVALTLLGERDFEGIRDQGRFWWAVVKYLPLALVIGFLEDMLFFGLLATMLGRRFLPCVLIYAITHFLAPAKSWVWAGEGVDLGLEALRAMGHSLRAAGEHPVEVAGLVLVGSVLALATKARGHIWLAMGIHGGWYYVRTISRRLGEDRQGELEWLFGTDRFYDGVLGWLAILTTALVFWFNTKESRKRAPQESAQQEDS